MNTNKMVNCLYEDLKAVQVVFKYGDHHTSKQYTYKTFDDYEIGDECIVDSPRNGYVVVQVVGTDSSMLEEDHRYKWVVQKVDDSNYKSIVEKEDQAIQKLSRLMIKSKRKEAMDKIKEMLGEESDQLQLLADDLNKIESE